MRSRCGPPKFDEQDWSKFDFTRWHLDGLAQDAATTAFGSLTEKFFNSDEWRESFSASLPELQGQALAFLKNHSEQLRAEQKTVAQDYETRTASAQARSDDYRKAVEASTAPPVVQATPGSYHLVARVTADDSRLGLAGLSVRIMDARNQKAPLAESVTDVNGNAVLTVGPEAAKEADKSDETLEILSPEGKSLLAIPNGVCVRVNQVETKAVTLRRSAEIEPLLTNATAIRAQREAQGRNLATRAASLKVERQTRLDALDCRLKDNEELIAQLQPPDAPVPKPSTGRSSGDKSGGGAGRKK
jgi:hypothetical protein